MLTVVLTLLLLLACDFNAGFDCEDKSCFDVCYEFVLVWVLIVRLVSVLSIDSVLSLVSLRII